MAAQLVTGDPMPTLMATDLEGASADLTAVAAGSWTVILLYRGDW